MAGSVRAPPRRQARPLRRNKRCASAGRARAGDRCATGDRCASAGRARGDGYRADDAAAAAREPHHRALQRRPGLRGHHHGTARPAPRHGALRRRPERGRALPGQRRQNHTGRARAGPSLEVTRRRPPRRRRRRPPRPAQSFEDGDRVEARFGFGKQWYGGRITGGSALAGYDVVYDDGDRESGVAAELIRPIIREFVELPPEHRGRRRP